MNPFKDVFFDMAEKREREREKKGKERGKKNSRVFVISFRLK